MTPLTRRQWLAATAALAASPGADATGRANAAEAPKAPFRFMLNTATIMGQNLTLSQEVDVAAKAGYQAFEPWIRKIEEYVKGGGSLKDVAKRIRDHGLTVESAIGFANWIVEDATARKKGLEQAKRDMDLVAQLGGKRIASPPAGATESEEINLFTAAERYRALIEVGRKIGVVPQVEVWGFSKNLSRLGETALVAVEAQHPQACVLADVYHLHKGGSGFHGLRVLGPGGMQVFHMNDYPADPPRARITDAHRVYPGDGVAPLVQMLRDLRDVGFRGLLSLELFNRTYWKQDALTVARTGLEKMKAVVAKALA
jgi:sugar phosphate isomerase/epimerase